MMEDIMESSSTARPRTKDIIDPDYPLLEANRSKIEAIEHHGYQYGPDERQRLDVYHPLLLTSPTFSKPRIIIFFHGGGFTAGDLSWPPRHLVHANLGAFFASRGILTVVATYRLVPHSTFPQGSEDVRDAISWVTVHLKEAADIDNIFLIGHSAGGVHVAGLLLSPSLSSPTLSQSIRGVLLMGVPFEIGNGRRLKLRTAAKQYYGNAKKIASNQPLGLLRRLDPQYIATLPPIQNILAESEPRTVISGSQTFCELFNSKGGNMKSIVLQGHDHTSPILSLSSGSSEQWGEDVVQWLQTLVSNKGRLLHGMGNQTISVALKLTGDLL